MITEPERHTAIWRGIGLILCIACFIAAVLLIVYVFIPLSVMIIFWIMVLFRE